MDVRRTSHKQNLHMYATFTFRFLSPSGIWVLRWNLTVSDWRWMCKPLTTTSYMNSLTVLEGYSGMRKDSFISHLLHSILEKVKVSSTIQHIVRIFILKIKRDIETRKSEDYYFSMPRNITQCAEKFPWSESNSLRFLVLQIAYSHMENKRILEW